MQNITILEQSFLIRKKINFAKKKFLAKQLFIFPKKKFLTRVFDPFPINLFFSEFAKKKIDCAHRYVSQNFFETAVSKK